jgi:hypothetical protein
MAANPDQLCPPPSPTAAVTVGEMRARRWFVTADCQQCRTRVHVDLDVMMKTIGSDFVLWGKRPRCKVWVRWTLDRRCEGRVVFLAQSSQTGSVVPLKMSGAVRDALDLRSQAKAYRR